MRFYTFLFLLSLGLIFESVAQEIPLPDGEIEDAQVIIEKDRKIVLPFAQRYFEKVTEQFDTKELQPLRYSFMETAFVPAIPVFRYASSEYKAQEAEETGNNEVRIGYGNYNSPLMKIALYNQANSNALIGMDFDHLSFGSGAVDGENSASGRSKIAFNGKYMTEASTFDGQLSYRSDFGYFYGYAPESDVDRDSIRQNYNAFNLRLAYNYFGHDKFSFKGQTSFNILQDNYEAQENLLNVSTELQYAVTEDVAIRLNAGANISNYTVGDTAIARNVYRFTPTVNFTRDKLSLSGGANIVFTDDETYFADGIGIFPYVAADYAISESFRVFMKLSGDVNELYLSSAVEDNFFVSENLSLQHARENYAGEVGLKGGANGFSYQLSAKVSEVQNLSFFANGLADSTRFDLIYDTDAIQVISVATTLGYQKLDFLQSSLQLIFNDYQTSTLANPWHRPTFELYFSNKIKATKKLSFGLNASLLGGITAFNLQSETSTTLPAIADISLQADYKITDNWGAFLQGNNLLNANYQRYWNYLNRGAMIKCGISYAF